MKLINNKILLTELAQLLETTPSNLRQHLHNKSGLGREHEKFGLRSTGDLLLDINSVLAFLDWISTKGRKITQENIHKTREILINARLN